MKRVLVTGASGFIGGHAATALRRSGEFMVVATARTPAPGIDATADLAQRRESDDLLQRFRPDAIVHAAGGRHGPPAALAASNIAAVRNLLWSAAAIEPRPRIVLIGSAAEYGPQPPDRRISETAICQPRSHYGRTKLAASRLGQVFSDRQCLDMTVLRLFNVVGPGMRGLPGEIVRHFGVNPEEPNWLKDAISLPMVRDFVRVADVAEACRRVLLAETVPGVINICTGQARSFSDLLREMSDLAGRDAPSLPSAYDATDVIVGDPSTCERILGFRPSAAVADMLVAAIAAERADA